MQYAGWAFQLMLYLGVSVYIGHLLDGWVSFSIPVGIWLLPLVVLIILLIKVVKDTTKK